jgi:hypothetical protein
VTAIDFDPAARTDIRRATRYYARERKQLGVDFKLEVEAPSLG